MLRFNDAHKMIVAALQLSEDDARKYRTFMLRHYTRGRSPNAVLALTRIHIDEERAKAAKLREEPAA